MINSVLHFSKQGKELIKGTDSYSSTIYNAELKKKSIYDILKTDFF